MFHVTVLGKGCLTTPNCNCSAGTVNVSPETVECESERAEQFPEHDQAYLWANERLIVSVMILHPPER